MSRPQFIDDPDRAAAFLDALGQPEYLYMDTEFLREDTYRAHLCLIQLTDGEQLACLDTLALGIPPRLGELLADPGVTKVLHAARQDLEVLYQATGSVPAPVYDTQIAAGLLGHGDQLGYAALVEAVLGITVEKGHARTDWSRRPLSEAQLAYAADDVAHLPELRATLDADLAARGRDSWLADECAALAQPGLYETDPAEAWMRVKGFSRLGGPALGRLARLAAWREQMAMDRNRPRRWILKDEALLALAESRENMSRLPPAVQRRHGSDLERLLELPMEDGEIPALTPRDRLEPAEERQLKRLAALVRAASERETIAAPLIATRKELERLVRGERELAVLTGWRRDVAGAALLEALEPG